MKRQLLTLAAGTLLLLSPALSKVAQANDGTDSPRMERSAKWKQMRQSLNLTEAQKASLKEIRKTTKAKIEAILTPEQKAQLQAQRVDRKAGTQKGDRMGGWKALNLTDAQKASLKQIRQESKAQMDAVFTPEQKAIIQQFKANNRPNHQLF